MVFDFFHLFWIIKNSDEKKKCMVATITEGLAFQDPDMPNLNHGPFRCLSGIQAIDDDGQCFCKYVVIILTLVFLD